MINMSLVLLNSRVLHKGTSLPQIAQSKANSLFQEKQRRNDVSSQCFINDGVGAWQGQHSLEEPLYQIGAVNLQDRSREMFPSALDQRLSPVVWKSSGRQFSLEGASSPLLPCAATLWSGGQRLLPLLWVLQDDFPSIPKCS